MPKRTQKHSKSNTKAFWKTFKKYSVHKNQNPPISIDTFYEYFKNLNDCEKDDADKDIVCDNPIYDAILNDEIIEGLIIDAIKD